MKKLIYNLIAWLRRYEDQEGEYQKSSVTLERAFPAINDLSKVNFNVSGRKSGKWWTR